MNRTRIVTALTAAAVSLGAGLLTAQSADAATLPVNDKVCVSTNGQTNITVRVYCCGPTGVAADYDIPWGKCSNHAPVYMSSASGFGVWRGTHCINEATGSNFDGPPWWSLDKTYDYMFSGSNVTTRLACYNS